MAKNIETKPLVSVVMSVYNAEEFLHEAVDSILNQSFRDFELIIINDGSTDDSLKILQSYHDPRIILSSRKNKGLVASLNEGIEKSNGEYIARQDADDISAPSRLAIQYELAQKRNAILVGSSFEIIDEAGRRLGIQANPTNDFNLKRALYVRNPFGHGSMMFQRESFLAAGGYSGSVGPVEDYDLWLKLSSLGVFVASKEILYSWRENLNGISHTKSYEQTVCAEKLKIAYNKLQPAKYRFSLPRLLSYYRLLVSFTSYSQDLTRLFALEEVSYIGLFKTPGAKLAQSLQALLYFPKSYALLLKAIIRKVKKA